MIMWILSLFSVRNTPHTFSADWPCQCALIGFFVFTQYERIHQAEILHQAFKITTSLVRQDPYSPNSAPCDFWVLPNVKTIGFPRRATSDAQPTPRGRNSPTLSACRNSSLKWNALILCLFSLNLQMACLALTIVRLQLKRLCSHLSLLHMASLPKAR